SRMGWPAPWPSCSAPGHQYLNAHLTPSSLTSSKWPFSTIIAAMPSHLPCVGSALKSQGQPGSQLQFFMYGPSMRQSATTSLLLLNGAVEAVTLTRVHSARNACCAPSPLRPAAGRPDRRAARTRQPRMADHGA